jgi:uncharacterized protein (TIGR02271 family)
MGNELMLDQVAEWRGRPVYSSEGDKIGSVEEIFYDEQTQKPEWIGIGTGFLRTKRVVVPIHGAEIREDAVHVPHTKDQVKDSPDIDEDEISQETERELYSYYGIPHSKERSDTVLPEGDGRRRGRKDKRSGEEVTRAEEELRVGKRGVEAGRARLRKWVETEPAAVDVELQRETARVTRERVDQPVADAEIGEEQVEVPLRAEEPVVQKQAVAKERVRLEKDVTSDRETVTDEVRKERVEVEGDAEER